MKSTFARRISIMLVLAMVLAMLPVAVFAADAPTTLYMQPNTNWLKDGARFAAYFFGNGETWVDMTDADADGVYEVAVPEGYPSVIFCRMNPSAAANNWDNKWNQTSDLTVPTDGTNCYAIAPGTWDKGAGTWSTYTPGDEVTEATTAPKNYAYYVAGSFNNWNECNDDYGMTLVDGLYTLELTLAAGTYTFKVTDGTWANSWGLNGTESNYEFVLTEEAKVTITFDTATNIPAITSSAMGEVEIYDYYLIGEMNGWTMMSSQYGMTANGDGTYSITIDLVAGTYQYKVNNGTWDVAFPAGTDNASVTVSEDCAVTFTVNPTDGTLTATGTGVGETPVEPPFDPVEITSAAVKGTIPGLDWDETAETGVMTLVDGIYTLTIPAVPASEVGAAAYAFKVVANGSWDTAYPESDWTFYLNAECDVTITFNPETYEVTLAADGLTYDAPSDGTDTPVDPETSYYVAGSFNEWNEKDANYVMVAGENGTYTYTFTALAAGSYSLKVTDGTWDNNWTAAQGSEYLGSDGNLTFTVTAACDVVVTFDGTSVSVAGDNVTAKAAEALVVDKVVIAGGVTGDDTANPGNMFNGLIWTLNADYYVNCLYDTEDTPGVYSITFMKVAAGSYDFKIFINDDWSINFATGLEVTSGATETAWFNALGNSTVVVAEDNSTVTFVLDLTNTVNVGDNASMTVTVEAPVEGPTSSAPETLVIGGNDFVIGAGDTNAVVSTFTATADGVLNIIPTAMSTANWMTGELEAVPAEYINGQFNFGYTILVNGESKLLPVTIEVTAGESYEIGVQHPWGSAAEITLTLCDNHNIVYSFANNKHTVACATCGISASVDGTSKLKINSAYMELAADISLIYKTTVDSTLNNPYMVFTMGENETVVWDYEEADGKYLFRYEGINPQQMGDNINAKLYVTIGGVEVSVAVDYSILTACKKQLSNAEILGDTKLKNIVSDLLVYGEKAQIFTGTNTDALVTAGLSLTPGTFPGVDAITNKQNLIGDKVTYDIKSAGLTLSNKIAVRVYFALPEDYSAYTFSFTINGKETVYDSWSLTYDETKGQYYIDYDEFQAIELDDTITVYMTDGTNQVGRTLEYSVNTYIKKQGGVDSDFARLLQAIYNYGVSAKAFAGV